MKVSIERKPFPVFKTDIYVLSVGTHRYHYEKLADILYRLAVIFEPHPEEEKSKRKYTKKPERFPLGDAILKVLNDIPGHITVDRLMSQIKTPKPYKKAIWVNVLSKLVKKNAIKVVVERGEKMYGRAK